MLVINDLAAMSSLPDRDLRSLIEARIRELEPFVQGRLDELVRFIVVEPGESLDVISKQLGFPLLSNRWTGARFGDSSFSPSFELIEEHPAWFEVVFILSDDGSGAELFVPKHPDVDATLLAMCERYALPTPRGDSSD